MPVQRVKTLDGLARLRPIGCGPAVARCEFSKVQAAVGQHTVYVEKSHLDALRLQ